MNEMLRLHNTSWNASAFGCVLDATQPKPYGQARF